MLLKCIYIYSSDNVFQTTTNYGRFMEELPSVFIIKTINNEQRTAVHRIYTTVNH